MFSTQTNEFETMFTVSFETCATPSRLHSAFNRAVPCLDFNHKSKMDMSTNLGEEKEKREQIQSYCVSGESDRP